MLDCFDPVNNTDLLLGEDRSVPYPDENRTHRSDKYNKRASQKRPNSIITRNVQSQMNKRTLGQVHPGKDSMKYLVQRYSKTVDKITIEIMSSTDKEIVQVKQIPECSCLWKASHVQEVCRHILWAILNLCGADLQDKLLYQIAYTSEEYSMLKDNSPNNIESIPVAIRAPVNSDHVYC